MIDFGKVIHSDLVVLRPIVPSDFQLMGELTQDKDMWYYFTEDLSDQRILKQWVLEAVDQHKNKQSLPFVMINPNLGELMGTTRIANISERHQRVEIGWTWIAKPYQGTGINQHVKRLLFKYLFTKTPVVRIEFKTDVLNIAAQKGMIKAGLQKEGVLRSHTLMTNQRRRDTLYFSILKSEWQENQIYN